MIRTPRKALVVFVLWAALAVMPAPWMHAQPARPTGHCLILDRLDRWLDAVLDAVGFVVGANEATLQVDSNGSNGPTPTALGPTIGISQTSSDESDAAPQLDPNG